ncbi:MAG TPA: thioredoxin [Bryobacteraceae bacterium]|nr:thioredoxin [Bryobacteraceae bacterium]
MRAFVASELHPEGHFKHHSYWSLNNKMAAENTAAAQSAASHVLHFTDGAFDQEVLKSEVPVLVDFWAPWCGPCKAMSPTVDALALEYAGKVKIGKMNTDENPETPMRYRVQGIPTLLLFKGGKVVDQRVGAMPKPEVKKMLDPHVG